MRNPKPAPKSALAFSGAALFCVVAVITRIAGSPTIVPIIAIIVAGIALFIGLSSRASLKMVDHPVVFTDDQVTQLRELKSRGQEAAAIRQAQLWSRGSSNDAVADAVRKL
ncbi:putative membrane protein [Corynebacterium deserti GIMN1.010]|uniref:Putative membrane protein n=1 Tax=Corynebacterium deserti GIMN1.010 TaxID=931089 RepID=A0A0M3QA19_9CORY|nr:hypothetical protein [Corynebacterium deserti]ALC06533.1 putative membrane protein [Corynebacterium deserti GIMN1.010]